MKYRVTGMVVGALCVALSPGMCLAQAASDSKPDPMETEVKALSARIDEISSLRPRPMMLTSSAG
jgi:outer membrane murein-binding lipoprotein Lpp